MNKTFIDIFFPRVLLLVFISIFTLVSVSFFQANAILQKWIFKSLARNQWFKGTFLWIKAGVKPQKKKKKVVNHHAVQLSIQEQKERKKKKTWKVWNASS